MLGLIGGKLLGIFSFPYLLIKSGLASLGEGISWKHLAGVGLLGGIGFTMSMFISNLAFNDADVILTSKLSVLVGSAIAAISGLCVFLFSKAENSEQ
jgi:NhaA family Na+:H+ antiporter